MTKDIQLIKNLVAKNVSYLPKKSTPSEKRVSLVREFQDRLLVDLNNTNINSEKMGKRNLNTWWQKSRSYRYLWDVA